MSNTVMPLNFQSPGYLGSRNSKNLHPFPKMWASVKNNTNLYFTCKLKILAYCYKTETKETMIPP